MERSVNIWDTLKTHAKAQFLDVIQWMEDDRTTVVYRFPVFNQAIQDLSLIPIFRCRPIERVKTRVRALL